MEVWPLDSVPLTLRSAPKKTRVWSGTLVAEWLDRGLTDAQEERLRQVPVFVAGMGLLFVVAAITGGRPVVALATFVVLAILALVPAYWSKLRSRRADRITLTLDPEKLTITRRSAAIAETTQLLRSETGLLIRSVESPRNKQAETLQLGDETGGVRLVLADRFVQISTVPFGVAPRALGVNPKRARLAVLIGTWWPDPSNRATQMKQPTRGLWDATERAWGQPDLQGIGISVPTGAQRGVTD